MEREQLAQHKEHRKTSLGHDRDTQTFHFRSPWIPTFGNPNFGGEAVGLPRYTDIDFSLLIRSLGVGHGLSTIYQAFQLYIRL